MIEVEICINSDNLTDLKENIQAASDGGASRIELCRSMEYGGLTPTREGAQIARNYAPRNGLMVMIRPRKGGFLYSQIDLAEMHTRIETAAEDGADGVVLGVLTNSQQIDKKHLSALIKTAKGFGLTVTVHRAVDAAVNRGSTFEVLKSLEVDRILTSGTAWNRPGGAADGIQQLRETILQVGTQIEVVIGGGINPENVQLILNQLPLNRGRISVHAYSSVLENSKVSKARVKALVHAVHTVKY